MSSYRSYSSWNKGLGSSGTSSYSSGLGSKITDSGGKTSQYDYSSRRYGSGGGSVGTGGSSSLSSASSSSYRAPPVSYRSPYTSGARDRSTSRDKSSTAALIDKYGSKENLIDKYGSKENVSSSSAVSSAADRERGTGAGERLSLRDKYNAYGTYPGRDVSSRVSGASGYGSKTTAQQKQEEEEEEKKEREREASSGYRSLSRRTSIQERDLSPSDLPQEKLYGSSSSLSSYSRLYGRGSAYSRSNSRDAGDSGSSATSTPATTPVQIPTSLRFGSGARYGGMSVRSPASEKPPTVFGHSSSSSTSDRYGSGRYSRYGGASEDRKSDSSLASPTTPTTPTVPELPEKEKEAKDALNEGKSKEEEGGDEKPAKVYITVVTRGTSPTPPSTSPYLRSRRADLARVLEKTVVKPKTKPEMVDKEVQSDRGDDTARHSRYGGTSRASPYLSAYLDRYAGSYSSPVSRYSSYTSRYRDREPSVSNSKPESEPSKPEPSPTEPAKTETPKTETTKPIPPRTLSLKSEVPKPEAPKVTTTTNSSPLPSKDLNKSTNKFPVTKSSTDSSTKDATKLDEPSKPVDTTSKDITTSKESIGENKSPALSKSDSTKNVIKKSPSVSRTNSNKSLTDSPASKSPIVSRSGPTKNLSDNSLTKSPSVSRSDSTKNVAESSKLKSPTVSLSEPGKNVTESTANKSTSLPRSDSVKSTSESQASKSPGVSRSESIKNLSESPNTKSPVVSRSNSFKGVTGKPPIGKTDSSTSSDVTSLKSKSASSSSLSEAPPLSPSASKTKTDNPLSPSASKTKTDVATTGDAAKPPPVPKPDGSKTSALHAGKNNLINKDFRKSPLNVGDLKAGLRTATGGSSLSSSDTETPEEAKAAAAVAAEKSAAALRLSKSLSKLAPAAAATAKANFLEVPKSNSGSSSPKRQSPIRTKSRRDVRKAANDRRSSSRSPRHSISHSSSGSDASESSSESSTDSSTETSTTESTSETSSSESENESAPRTSPRRRPRRSADLRASNRSSADDLSLTAEKPPRPPGAPKPTAAKQEAQSFLMRALAPVTNLFRRGADTENAAEESSLVRGAASNQSISKTSDKESTDGDKPRKGRLLRKIESGERAWWLDESADIPEGIIRLQSNKSIARLAEATAELKKSTDSVPGLPRTGSNQSLRSSDKEDSGSGKAMPDGIVRLQSNKSIAKLAEAAAELQKSDSKKKFRIRKVESGERPWWLDSSSNIPEGIQRILSNSSLVASSDGEKRNTIPRVRSNRSVTKMAEEVDDGQPMLYRIRHVESGEKAWWLSSCGDIPEGIVRLETSSSESSDSEGEKEKTKTADGQVPKFPLVLPDSRRGSGSPREPRSRHASSSGSGRQSPYDNINEQLKEKQRPAQKKARPKNLPLFIGSHTNIDDILGTAATMVEPAMGVSRLKRKLQGEEPSDDDLGDSECEEVSASDVRVHDSTAQTPELLRLRSGSTDSGRRRSSDTSGMIKLDDAALQLYKDGDYGSYLDLEASLSEQQEELEGFQENRKNSIVLRTQLSVRVHTIIEKLLNSEGRELRRALFSLKQIFQEDKDLVHEFVQNDGLACLIKVGSEADQNYQNYILRALGQVMLYVDGMNGVMDHNQTVQWLYTLIASKYRLVVKTALKLLLVFVEYVETNCLLLIKAIHAVDKLQGVPAWSNIMKLLKDYDAADTELLIYATTLINKTLNGIPDQDTYYDQVDALEEQGMEGAVQRYMSKQGTDLDLLRQLQIYEAVLHHEDGEDRGSPLKQLDENIRKTLRNRKSLNESMTTERRKSRRHSTGTSPLSSPAPGSGPPRGGLGAVPGSPGSPGGDLAVPTTGGGADDGDETGSSSSRSSPGPGEVHVNGSCTPKEGKDVGVTPALRRRRERAERQRSFIREQQETAATLKASLGNTEDSTEDDNQKISQRIGNGSVEGSNKFQMNRTSSRKDMTPILNAVNTAESENKAVDSNGILKKPWVLSMMYGKNDGTENVDTEEIKSLNENGTDESSERKMLLQLKRENTVKDLTQKLSNQNVLHSPVEEGNKINRIGDMTGLISKAKEGLAKSKSKADVTKSPTGENVPKQLEVKKSETELHWEELVSSMKRPLSLCDLDFTDLKSEDEVDVLSPTHISNGIPPPPPPVPMAPGMPRVGSGAPPPPPPVSRLGSSAPPPPLFGVNLRNNRNGTAASETNSNKNSTSPSKKTKKTVKLFWKEVRDDPIILAKLQKTGMIWDELNPVYVDTQKLEHLFESRAKDLITKKQQEMNKNKEIIVLDHKRSNAINIGMTKLPPPRSIKTAILKMDATIMNREGIEKLLTMLPTEEERAKIQEAQMANPELPLGSAEQFLLTLASISELPARLKLWAFKLDYENSEKEIAEPLMDLKQGMELLRSNKTFRGILSTLLSIGIFLNGAEVKGFQIEYLAKVPEVKDTVHKHSLLHHLCHMVMEKFPESSDLYSEIGAVTRASKVDFDELSANIQKMEQECKASWDHLKVIAKHDGSTMKTKMSDFLADCAERIIVLGIVHRRVMNRFLKFLLWLGIPLHRVQDIKPNEFCRIVSEFSLEYRTTRERVLQQLEKKANHRERNKTRGKMITEVGKFRTKEDRADAELRQLLGSDVSDVESIHRTLPWRRQRKDLGLTSLGPLIANETINGNLTDGDDEILESLVKTATKAPTTRTAPRERKRTRHADRKSLRRTLRNGLSEEDKKHLAAYIKGY